MYTLDACVATIALAVCEGILSKSIPLAACDISEYMHIHVKCNMMICGVCTHVYDGTLLSTLCSVCKVRKEKGYCYIASYNASSSIITSIYTCITKMLIY